MNVFILNTGRCGSMTFIRACQHISNFTSAHESLSHVIGCKRLAYPAQHIEADNRLSWYLGRLDQYYGDSAFYVHLRRDHQAVAKSFMKRMHYGIMQAYSNGIIMPTDTPLSMNVSENEAAYSIALDYIETVESNIEHFLKDKSHSMSFQLENANKDFETFWHAISAQGDYQQAQQQWQVRHNASAQL